MNYRGFIIEHDAAGDTNIMHEGLVVRVTYGEVADERVEEAKSIIDEWIRQETIGLDSTVK